MTANIKSHGVNAWLVSNKLQIDRRFERPIAAGKVRRIVDNFDPDAIGVIYVSKRKDGTFVILDGQHRVSAIKLLGWGDQRVPCHVYEGLSLSDEAALFVQFNENRTKPKPIDIFRAKVQAGDQDALDLNEVMQKYGLHFGHGEGIGVVRSVGTFQRVQKATGLEVLDQALLLSMQAWGSSDTAFLGDNVAALALLIARHGRALDRARLAKRLTPENPSNLIVKARTFRAQLGKATGAGRFDTVSVVAQMMLNLYNHGLVTEQRVLWEDRGSKDYWRESETLKQLQAVRRSAKRVVTS